MAILNMTNNYKLYLWKLLGNVSAHKHSLQIDPQILYNQPILQDVGRVGQLGHPLLDSLLEWCIIPFMIQGLLWITSVYNMVALNIVTTIKQTHLMLVYNSLMPLAATKSKSGKISKSCLLTPPNPQEHVMSLKCEQPLDELTVKVWLLYDHQQNVKYCT